MTTDHPAAAGSAPGDDLNDPEQGIALLLDGYFDHLGAALAALPLPPGHTAGGLVADIHRHHDTLVESDRDSATDPAADANLRLTLALVAGYRVLEPPLGRERAFGLVRAALLTPFADEVRDGTRAMLDAAPDPFRAMVELARARETESFGPTFTFEHPVDDDREFVADIRRCFYHDITVKHGLPELTPMLCAFDEHWIGAIDERRHGFRFDRSETIGTGGTHCPFRFTRVPCSSTPDRTDG